MANYILRIEYDFDPESPMDWDCSWKLISFSRRHSNFQHPDNFVKSYSHGDIQPIDIGLRRKLDVGLAHWLSCYQHGGEQWGLQGEVQQCRWDTAQLAGILLWEHPAKEMGAKTLEGRQKDARAFLETYNAYCNGNVYGFVIEDLDDNHVDSGWGFYDKESLLEAIRHTIKAGDRVKLMGDADYILDDEDFPGIEVVKDFEEVGVVIHE